MKFQYRAALSCALLVATLPTVQASETSVLGVEFSGNVALTTDYIFRGISLSDENWAIQGQFDATHSSGVYASVWASNTNFVEDNTVAPGDRANIEIDVSLGYAGEINNFGYDVFATRYIYPGTGKHPTTGKSHQYNDYHELTLALSYTLPAKTKFGLRYDYAPHWAGQDTGKANNYLLTVSQPLPKGFSVGASLGRQDFRRDLTTRIGFNDYTYYGAQVAYTFNDFTLALDFSDTNARNPDGSDLDNGDERVVFTLSKTF